MMPAAARKILGFASIPFFLAIIAILALLNDPTVFEPPYVLAVMNTLFLGIIPLIIAYIAARVFMRSGSLSMILMGAGILVFGLGSIAAGWLNQLPGGANMTVTVHNTCACIGSVFILAGAVISRPTPVTSEGTVRSRKVAVLYFGIIVFVLFFSLAAMQGLIPAFFVPGAGPTELRQVILENAVVFFAISSLIFMSTHLRERTDFFFWYSVSLALISIGLVAVFIQPSVGSLIGWAGRSAQYAGFVVALYADFIAYRLATSKGILVESVIANFFIDAEKSYRQLVETATDAIITFDEDYRIILWNAAAGMMFGYTHAEAIGSSFLQLAIDDMYIAGITNDGDKVQDMQIPVPKPAEISCRRKDGTLFPAELTVSRRWQDGRLICTVILRDLTERMRVEGALRESEERYRTLFDNMIEGFAYCRMVYDSEGHPQDFIYLNVNRAFDRITGTKTVTMKRVTEVYPGILEGYPELFEIYGRVALTGIPESFEIDFKPIEKWLHISVYSPAKEYFVAVFEDITERKLGEDALRQANKQLNLLSSITRHDILNQLLALKGYIGLSLENPDDKKTLVDLLGKGDKAATAIERQIQFAKDYQSMGSVAPAWQNVNAIIHKAVAGLPVRDVRVEADRSDLEVYADPLFEKVFYNLINNALNYGGEQMTAIRVSSHEKEGTLILVCEDDGPGISEEDKKHIFDKGFGRNTGLGLFLTREILLITGITITETGVPGKGARFEITVPKGAYRFTSTGEK